MPAILIIDDEVVLNHQIALALEARGHAVNTAGTRAEAIEAATFLGALLIFSGTYYSLRFESRR